MQRAKVFIRSIAFIFPVVIINENNAISSVNELLDVAYILNLAGKKIQPYCPIL